VENKIAPGHRLRQRRKIKVVAVNEFEIRVTSSRHQKFILTGGKIVPADNLFAAGQQAVNEIAANKTGGAGDKNLFHDWMRSLERTRPARQHFWDGAGALFLDKQFRRVQSRKHNIGISLRKLSASQLKC
jgi:hypothetical protein